MPTKLTSKRTSKLIEAAQDAIRFAVEGRGEFPFDMLRYDLCWPASETNASLLSYGVGSRVVNLRGLKIPTSARWASFGWKVLLVEP